MNTNIISANIAKATIHYLDRSEKITEIAWEKHPKFKGVYLKNMITGKDSNHLFSAHLIKIDPNCSLETHCHENQLELHEVIDGQGTCSFIDQQFAYHLGKMTVIPKGQEHNVQAGKNGLMLLAKFFPATL